MTKIIVSPCGDHEYAPIFPADVLFILQRKPTEAELVLCAGICADNGYRTYAVQWVDTRRNKKVLAVSTATGRGRIDLSTQSARVVVLCSSSYFGPLGTKAHVLGTGVKAPYKGAKIREMLA